MPSFKPLKLGRRVHAIEKFANSFLPLDLCPKCLDWIKNCEVLLPPPEHLFYSVLQPEHLRRHPTLWRIFLFHSMAFTGTIENQLDGGLLRIKCRLFCRGEYPLRCVLQPTHGDEKQQAFRRTYDIDGKHTLEIGCRIFSPSSPFQYAPCGETLSRP